MAKSIITVFKLAKVFAAVLRCVCQASGPKQFLCLKLCTHKPLGGKKTNEGLSDKVAQS